MRTNELRQQALRKLSHPHNVTPHFKVMPMKCVIFVVADPQLDFMTSGITVLMTISNK